MCCRNLTELSSLSPKFYLCKNLVKSQSQELNSGTPMWAAAILTTGSNTHSLLSHLILTSNPPNTCYNSHITLCYNVIKEETKAQKLELLKWTMESDSWELGFHKGWNDQRAYWDRAVECSQVRWGCQGGLLLPASYLVHLQQTIHTTSPRLSSSVHNYSKESNFPRKFPGC